MDQTSRSDASSVCLLIHRRPRCYISTHSVGTREKHRDSERQDGHGTKQHLLHMMSDPSKLNIKMSYSLSSNTKQQRLSRCHASRTLKKTCRQNANNLHHSVTDILKHSTNILQIVRRLLPKQQILNLTQRPRLPIVNKMIPRTRITIQHSRRLDDLPSIFLPTPLALESIVRVARSVVAILEEFAKGVEREVALNILRRIDNTVR